MNYLQRTESTPAGNLALDEWLLGHCEGTGEETLRVWESPVPFVVLGLSNRLSLEADVEACAKLDVPIHRRISGGGTVVQGPGCLGYALTLRLPATGPLASITATNRLIMETNARVLGTALGRKVTVQGDTDLALDGRKFSGNAQKRGRKAILFHGTVLYSADLDFMARLLRHPSREPGWRQRRTHADFLANFPAGRDQLIAALRTGWGVERELQAAPGDLELQESMRRHESAEWVHRFA